MLDRKQSWVSVDPRLERGGEGSSSSSASCRCPGRQSGTSRTAIAALVVIKLLAETSYLSIGAWLAVLLAGVMAYGAYLRYREIPAQPTPHDSPSAGLA